MCCVTDDIPFQPWSRNLTTSDQWYDVDTYSNVFGLEPNYPCCTVNHPQAYPKFLANSFVGTEDGGLAHVFLAPGNVTVELDGYNPVSVSADTAYPFGFTIEYTVTTEDNFPFYVRIPNWASADSTIQPPGSDSAVPIKASNRNLQKVDIVGGKTNTFKVTLDTKPRFEEPSEGTVAVYYGPLLYSLAIEFEKTETAPYSYKSPFGPLPENTTHPHSHDHTLIPITPWNIAIDPSQITVVSRNVSSSELPNPIWDLGAPPVELRVAAVEIDWPVENDTAAPPPKNPRATSKPFSARFVPYGSAKLHMAHLPRVHLPKVDLSKEK